MFCNNCGNQLPDDAKFCNQCGANVVNIIENTCLYCGNKLPDNATFCNVCGAKCSNSSDELASKIASEIEFNHKRGMECLRGDEIRAAFPFFLKAAELGHADSQWQAANMLNYGNGVLMDKTQATQLYYKAAMQGHSGAQYGLAVQYIAGEMAGVQKNFAAAARWLRLSAEQNYPDALLLLGFLHDPMELNNTKRTASEEHMTVPYDVDKAAEYYTKAIENGSETAFIYLARLRMFMRFMECKRSNVPISGTNMAVIMFQEISSMFNDETEYVSAIGISGLFQKRLNGTLNYAYLARDEVPLLIIDTTMSGNGKNGVLLTTQALYFKDTFEKAVRFDFDHPLVLTVRKVEYFFRIFLNGKPIELYQKKKQSAERIVCIIKCLISGFKYINKTFSYSP